MSARWSRPGPLCRIRLDLDRLPGGLDGDAARELLPTAPGVVRVEIPSHGHHVLVLHDATTSVAQLWNWLRDQATHPAGIKRQVERER